MRKPLSGASAIVHNRKFVPKRGKSGQSERLSQWMELGYAALVAQEKARRVEKRGYHVR